MELPTFTTELEHRVDEEHGRARARYGLVDEPVAVDDLVRATCTARGGQ